MTNSIKTSFNVNGNLAFRLYSLIYVIIHLSEILIGSWHN